MTIEKIQAFRAQYQPATITSLLIAESPPLSTEEETRFFYNPQQTKWDFLFQAIMEVVFPAFTQDNRRGKKAYYLEQFRDAGFYLLDATDHPINTYNERQRHHVLERESAQKLQEIATLVSQQTPIFLIKKNIFHLYAPKLRERGYHVAHDAFLPFPSTGNQRKFKEQFRASLSRYYPVRR